jgi:hypothetical protein
MPQLTNRFLVTSVLLAAMLVVIARPAAGQEGIRTEQIVLVPGQVTTKVNGRIAGRESVSYTIGAQAGQTMTVTLSPSNSATYFNVYEPGGGPGDEALASSEITGPMVPELNRFSGELTRSGTYTISVFLYRSAARRNEVSTYTLDVGVSALAPGEENLPVVADFADGLEGGPDFWDVSTPAGGSLRLREAPSERRPSLVPRRNGRGSGRRRLGSR